MIRFHQTSPSPLINKADKQGIAMQHTAKIFQECRQFGLQMSSEFENLFLTHVIKRKGCSAILPLPHLFLQ